MTTWTPAVKQNEPWTPEDQPKLRAFDPFGFDRLPSFDTGSSAGVWDDDGAPVQTWTPK